MLRRLNQDAELAAQYTFDQIPENGVKYVEEGKSMTTRTQQLVITDRSFCIPDQISSAQKKCKPSFLWNSVEVINQACLFA